MTLCTDDCETTRSLHLVRKLDIGTTTCHICGDGHCTCLSGVLYNLCLTSVLLCIEDLMVDAAHTEHSAQELRGLDICSTHEHRSALRSKLSDLVDHSLELCLLCLIYKVILIMTRDRSVCRDYHYIKLVD